MLSVSRLCVVSVSKMIWLMNKQRKKSVLIVLHCVYMNYLRSFLTEDVSPMWGNAECALSCLSNLVASAFTEAMSNSYI